MLNDSCFMADDMMGTFTTCCDMYKKSKFIETFIDSQTTVLNFYSHERVPTDGPKWVQIMISSTEYYGHMNL